MVKMTKPKKKDAFGIADRKDIDRDKKFALLEDEVFSLAQEVESLLSEAKEALDGKSMCDAQYKETSSRLNELWSVTRSIRERYVTALDVKQMIDKSASLLRDEFNATIDRHEFKRPVRPSFTEQERIIATLQERLKNICELMNRFMAPHPAFCHNYRLEDELKGFVSSRPWEVK